MVTASNMARDSACSVQSSPAEDGDGGDGGGEHVLTCGGATIGEDGATVG